MAKVYIAGKVKGLPTKETETKFTNAMIEINKGNHIAVNPVLFVKFHNESLVRCGGVALSDENPQQRKEILKICISLLMDCDYIYLCHDWQESEGAMLEKQVADFFKIPIYNA